MRQQDFDIFLAHFSNPEFLIISIIFIYYLKFLNET